MSAAYDSELWHDLFAMSGGAAAALAGLIFVAVSLNHEAILEVPALPALAARTLSMLIGLLLLSLVALVPGQSRVVLGIEVLVIGAVLAAVVLTTTLRNLGGSELLRWRASLMSLAIAAAVPAVIAGGFPHLRDRGRAVLAPSRTRLRHRRRGVLRVDPPHRDPPVMGSE